MSIKLILKVHKGWPSSLTHESLIDFIGSGGPKNVYEDITDVNLFSLFICNEISRLFCGNKSVCRISEREKSRWC